jgi:hypothetical protein
MRMGADRVVSIRVFARIEQQPNDVSVTELGGECECEVALLPIRGRKHPPCIFDPAQGCSDRQVDTGAAGNQSCDSLHLAMRGCCSYRAVWIGAALTKEIDEGPLNVTLARHAPTRNKRQCVV